MSIFESLLLEAIASALGLSPDSLRTLPLPLKLTDGDSELFELLDIVPSDALTLDTSGEAPRFSQLYGSILKSMPESLTTMVAKNAYENSDNWLLSNGGKIPIYIPSSTEVLVAIESASSFDYEVDISSCYSPSVTHSDLLSLATRFNIFEFIVGLDCPKIMIKLHFDRLVNVSVFSGNWFVSGAFISAYKSNGENWSSGSDTVTWDYLFGDNGVLKYIVSSLIAARGIKIELEISGSCSGAMVDVYKEKKAFIPWPFSVVGAEQNGVCTLSTTITLELLDDVSVLLLSAEKVDALMS